MSSLKDNYTDSDLLIPEQIKIIAGIESNKKIYCFFTSYVIIYYRSILGRHDGIGRRAGLKIPWWRHRVGSTPTAGTIYSGA